MEIKELIIKSHDIAKSKGWWDEERGIPELIELLTASYASIRWTRGVSAAVAGT